MNSTPPAATFLHRSHARVRQTWLVWSAAAVLVAAALNGAGRLGWFARGELYSAAPALASATFLVLWIRRARQLTRTRFALELDARWQLRSRLESAEELATHDSALAQAQRAEAAQAVSSRGEIGLAAWLSAVAVATLCLTLLLAEGSAYAFRAWRAFADSPAKPKAATPAKPASAPTPASLAWKGPEKEIKATPIEDIPLTASTESPQGFRKLSLEVSVNGEARPPRPLDPATLAEAAEPGARELKMNLPLDELGAKPGDVVSYHLTGEPAGAPPGTTVKSPLQSIQVRPPAPGRGGNARENPDVTEMMSRLFALRAAQVRLIDVNSLLAHLPDGKSNPAWQEENARAALDQKNLAAKSGEARDFAIEKKLPALLVTNLGAAMAPMLDAAKRIESGDNESALVPQKRALELIIECEKLFLREGRDGAPPPALVDDPFRDVEVLKLPPRAETPAGQLEDLAERQRAANDQLKPSAPKSPPAPGSVGGAESGIARDAGKLSGNGGLDSSAATLLRDAAASAGKTARHLEANDPQAAREPSAAALAALEKAVEIQDATGREIAVAELDRIRRSLNSASRETRSGQRGALLVRAREELYAAATQQQRTGSAEAARQLATVAELIAAPTLPGSSSPPNSTGRAHEIASAAARSQIALAPRPSALNRAIRQLNRAKGATALPPDLAANLELASQEGEWLSADDTLRELARKVSAATGSAQGGTPPAPAVTRDALDSALKLAAALEFARSVGQRDEIVRRFNVDEIDPTYRAAVETYFEKLSRDGAKATANSPSTPEQK